MIIVASVSCIYGLGSPEEYEKRVVLLTVGEEHDRDLVLREADRHPVRRATTSTSGAGAFRVKGDVVEVQPAYEESAYRIEFFGDEVEQITHFDPLTGEVYGKIEHLALFPGDALRDARRRRSSARPRRSARSSTSRLRAVRVAGQAAGGAAAAAAHRVRPRDDAGDRLLLGDRELLAPPRRPAAGVARRTRCSTSSRPTSCCSSTSRTQTVPQLGGMYDGDRSRKQTLVEHGFRLPSALDNRPLRFEEFLSEGAAGRVRLGDARAVTSCAHSTARSSSSSSARPGSSTPRSSCARPRTRSTIS